MHLTAAAAMRRKPRRTFAASSGVPVSEAKTRSWSTRRSPAARCAPVAGRVARATRRRSTARISTPAVAATTPSTRCSRRAGEPPDHRLGRSRGGLTTEVHLACEQGRGPVSVLITAGQRADCPQFVRVLERVRVLRPGPGRHARVRSGLSADPDRAATARRRRRTSTVESADDRNKLTPAIQDWLSRWPRAASRDNSPAGQRESRSRQTEQRGVLVTTGGGEEPVRSVH